MKRVAAKILQVILILLITIPTVRASASQNQNKDFIALEVVDEAGCPVSNLNIVWDYEDIVDSKTESELLFHSMSATDINGLCSVPIIKRYDKNGNIVKTKILIQNREDTENPIQKIYSLDMSGDKSVYTLVWKEETPQETAKNTSPSLTLNFKTVNGEPVRNLCLQYTHPLEDQTMLVYYTDKNGTVIVPKYEKGELIIHAYSPSPYNHETERNYKMKSFFLNTDFDGSLTYDLIFD